ncbi:hypothetical protein RJZ56_004925 [Blastomyces dermatitidis]|uniref:Chromosome transmission fidelity protein 4 n=3 Tax=Blastomyces TaxID=229219 RepID=A0A179UTC1_BLAGS|nr:chromosome transmission fidelity protein 4 [Blastomyces gilchristii SLH14081]XP_045277298.1 chromosome transmission fidelity protein 4 [Blastomyces dermatitidis ER-3]EGE81484.1 chromosome transmission fidelity protein 4 [Blastomyces dermatitidis ATCC 18188]EQL35553.1 chromosome transmission fidelity protein 4 [Blastomyces dermatitidis ATCC 26199]EEQ90596.1 chromosome transmission fidelity protein 4 [Blastomyces dermatitidis ER-3]OAT11110.1 chromosome transmission fidelity protein 4 [Blastom
MAKLRFPHHLRQSSILLTQSRPPQGTQAAPLHPPTIQLCAPHRADVRVPRRYLAQIRHDDSTELGFLQPTPVYFSAYNPQRWSMGLGNDNDNGDHKPVDERILKLGKTLRILSSHLPGILVNPLPQEILSPNISLHLFPSTHPHLPTVKGRVPYRAALWTAPVAWGSVPIVGNVRLEIMSERMVNAPSIVEYDEEHRYGDEKLVVRWRTEGGETDSTGYFRKSSPKGITPAANGRTATNGSTTANGDIGSSRTTQSALSSSSNGTNRGLSKLLGGDAPIFKLGKEEQFSGLFIFLFDDQGRIASHTIEHADESSGWDRTARVVTLTDWLLGKAKWGGSRGDAGATPALAVGLELSREDKMLFKNDP